MEGTLADPVKIRQWQVRGGTQKRSELQQYSGASRTEDIMVTSFFAVFVEEYRLISASDGLVELQCEYALIVRRQRRKIPILRGRQISDVRASARLVVVPERHYHGHGETMAPANRSARPS